MAKRAAVLEDDAATVLHPEQLPSPRASHMARQQSNQENGIETQ
jgi:hypothetical protein